MVMLYRCNEGGTVPFGGMVVLLQRRYDRCSYKLATSCNRLADRTCICYILSLNLTPISMEFFKTIVHQSKLELNVLLSGNLHWNLGLDRDCGQSLIKHATRTK